ncbi:MAG TPA: diguanylate cyclase [Longimicrobiaceae bacterium]|nr:diguanylate cyclase [Longimicrobiaceae bacterium]
MPTPLLLLLLALLAAATPSAAQAPPEAKDTLALIDGWKLKTGDSQAWADPAYDDSGWQAAPPAGHPWEEALDGYDGMGWFRRTVELPAGISDEAPVGLLFGTVGDAFEVYWNGVKLGGRGSLPPKFVEGVGPALFMVPPSALEKAQGNRHLLAVRVYNDYAYGGLMSPVKVGRYDLLASRRSPRDVVIGGLVSFFLAIGIYHLAFWLRRRSARENLHFAVLSLFISLYGATFASAFQAAVVPVMNPYRLGVLAMLTAGPFFMALIYGLFELRIGRREQAVMAAFGACFVAAAFLPLGVLAEFKRWIDAGLAAGLIAIVVRAMMAAPGRPHAHTLVVGTTAFSAALLYDLASEYTFVPVARVLPGVPSLFWIGFLVFVVAVGIATAGKWALTEVTALVDPLTELARRHVLEEALRRETDRLRRSGGSVALVMIDLDHFKRINDAWGHRVGDQVLARMGRLLRHTARNVDLPARFGGEEFAVLLYDSNLQGALAFAERFRANLRELRVPTPTGENVEVTASLGIAVGVDLVDPDELIETADRALYRAKGEGRDRLFGVELPLRRPVAQGQRREGAA